MWDFESCKDDTIFSYGYKNREDTLVLVKDSKWFSDFQKFVLVFQILFFSFFLLEQRRKL